MGRCVKEASNSASRDSGAAAAGLENELGPDSESGQHVEECVDAEEVDSTTHQVAHSGLRDAEKPGGLVA